MRYLLGLQLAAVALSVHAGAVYRCEQDGHLTYTDQPCAGGANATLLPGPVVTAPPTATERELARQHDTRLARDRAARDRADAKWLKDQKGLKDRAAAVRKAIIEHRVIRGMTADEVKSALGPPDRVQRSESHGSRKETWIYEGDGASRRVNFKNGEVSTASRRERESR